MISRCKRGAWEGVSEKALSRLSLIAFSVLLCFLQTPYQFPHSKWTPSQGIFALAGPANHCFVFEANEIADNDIHCREAGLEDTLTC